MHARIRTIYVPGVYGTIRTVIALPVLFTRISYYYYVNCDTFDYIQY